MTADVTTNRKDRPMGKITSTIKDVVDAVSGAEQKLAEARKRQGEAEREAMLEAQRRRREVFQQFADTFDPAADRQAVVDAGRALRDAIAQGVPHTQPLTDYVVAIQREAMRWRLASAAASVGATLREGVTLGDRTPDFRDEHGRGLPPGDRGPFRAWLGDSVLTDMVVEYANVVIDVERDAVAGAAQRAHDEVPGANPQWFKITALGAGIGQDFEDGVGSGNLKGLHFVKGVCYIQTDHKALPYYRSHPQYDVEPAFSVPGFYLAVAKRADDSGDHAFGPHAPIGA